jgi:hypothetical protein
VKIITIAAAVFLLIPGFASAQSPLPKEGTVKTTTYYTGTVKALPAGDDAVAVTYDVLGILINNAGQGAFHFISTQCVGGFTAIKGDFTNEQGVCSHIDRDGDKFFSRHSGSGRRGQSAVVKSELIGGTGKYSGMTGTVEGTRTALRPLSQGTAHTVAEATINYKLP